MKRIILSLIIAGLLAGVIIGRQAVYSVFRPPLATPIITPSPPPTYPVRLIIPRLQIDASVETVGLDARNRMAVPQDPNNVAWYKYGARPGETGNTVIAGHLDTPTGPAVFARLGKLQTGDTVTVVSSDGSSSQFTVTRTATYPDAAFPIADVFGPADTSRLNLITCQGSFDPASENYSHRLVIFTVFSQ